MIIGFSGHQRIDDPARWGWVRDQIMCVFREKAASADGVLSSLAIGGDQLFVESALAFGLAVNIVIPCEGYEATFPQPEEKSRFRRLLASAATAVTLPCFEPSEEAYLAAGKYVVDRAGLVVVLWNGRPAAGKGGTGDMVEYALAVNKPLIVINPNAMTITGI